MQGDGSQNCTASCQNEDDIFGSLDTLHNCMVYPTIADLYARKNPTNASASLAGDYNIQPSKMGSPLSNNIIITIQKCLMDYCNITLNGSDCSEGLRQNNASYPTSSPSNVTSTFYIYNDSEGGNIFDFCQYVPKSLNSDIGGIGV